MSIKEQFVSASMDQLGLLETRLNGLLKPVAPRREFVNSLRDRIHVTQNPAIISRFTNIQFVFMMILSVISGVVLVTMGARVLVSLLSTGKKNSSL
jgi:hypothetical protein